MKMSKIWIACALMIGFLSGFAVGCEVVNEPYEILPEESAPPIVVEVVEVVTPEPVDPEPIEESSEDPVEEKTKTYLGEFKITAYCPCSKCCGKWADGFTSTGTVATEGRTIAVDPDVIPYGSVVEINGKEYIAEDCGGSIKENRIDLFFDSHRVALEWGVQYHDVYIVG